MNFVQSLQSEAAATHKDLKYEGVSHQYDVADFQGYAGEFDPSVVEKLRRHHQIAHVESDNIWTIDAGYGLSQISHPKIQPTNNYVYHKSAGSGTFGYVVDTGIYAGHGEFAKVSYRGRVRLGYNAVRNGTHKDYNGHGTHVAAIMGGKTFGVAKRCNLISVKVIDDTTGHISDILDGYQWALKDIINKKRQGESVINVSVYGEFSYVFNSVLETAYRNGVTTIAAAGNENQDASKFSPGASEHAITVGATNPLRERAEFSNHGKQVNIFAPGIDIISAGIGGRWKSQIINGTSQASAYVAGLALYFKGLTNLVDATSTKKFMFDKALYGVVAKPEGSDNKFANNGVGE
ncbi:alkaline protease [Myriangium duriaei CBS 260.36]|uniref:Alkaline protease n=1 Tax=Myriangium duriaei CBS 260.36 TaxID=1168546 RepID=A0A9P4J044_9PEZI|nr:alkaline protease [Myriangium duriaei CBS 260.36]